MRRAIAAWTKARYAATLDPDSQILPTLGSKELVFSLARVVLDPEAGKDLVLTTSPGYPIPERGARYAGGEVTRLPLTEGRAFLPDLLRFIFSSRTASAVAPAISSMMIYLLMAVVLVIRPQGLFGRRLT